MCMYYLLADTHTHTPKHLGVSALMLHSPALGGGREKPGEFRVAGRKETLGMEFLSSNQTSL